MRQVLYGCSHPPPFEMVYIGIEEGEGETYLSKQKYGIQNRLRLKVG